MANNTGGWNSKKAQKALKKLHKGYLIVMVVTLLIGVAVGAYYAYTLTANDKFELIGEKSSTVRVGDTLSYTDEGIKCTSMGKDVSDKVQIRTNMTRSADGKTFTGSTDTEGEYFIEYTITEGRFQGLSRVRIFTIEDTENGNN